MHYPLKGVYMKKTAPFIVRVAWGFCLLIPIAIIVIAEFNPQFNLR